MRSNADVAGNDTKNRNQNKQVGKSGGTLANGNADLIVDQRRTITGYAPFYSPAQSRDKCDTDSQKPAFRSIAAQAGASDHKAGKNTDTDTGNHALIQFLLVEHSS